MPNKYTFDLFYILLLTV